MEVNLGPDLEAVFNDLAQRQGVAPEVLALDAIRNFLRNARPQLVPQDEWERRLLSAAKDCGVSLSDSALTSDGIYD